MALTKRWAANGIKSPIPNDPQGDNLVNYDEGFTTLYSTPIKDGGKPIGLATFNQLMYDITDEIIQNKSTLNQIAQQTTSVINDTQTNTTTTWSSQLINNKISTAAAGVINDTQTSSTTTWSSQLINNNLSTAVAGVINDVGTSSTTTWSSQFIDNKISTAAANIIDDSQTTSNLTWSSSKISAEISQGGGGTANIDDNTISTDKVWSSFKTNQMVKGGKTISITNFQTKTATADTEFVNNSANAQVVNLNVKVKTTKGTTQGGDQYLGDIVVYYNSTAQEVLRESVISQNITGTPNDKITSALGSVILGSQDTLLVKGVPTSLWTDAELEGYTANLTTETPEGLRFTAQEANSSVTLNKNGTPTELQLEYRTDTSSAWQNYTLGTAINLANIGSWVEMRNRGLQDTAASNSSNYHNFTMTGKIAASGNIMYLLDKTGQKDSVAFYCFYYLFNGCTSLTSAPELPATTLAGSCYNSMFKGCTSLTTAPELPATTLTPYCYGGMFSGCTSLTTAPELPATTLADSCYGQMFNGCTSLTSAPALPATTLASYCYGLMFKGCTSLTTAPSLPATTLAEFCYGGMFNGCTSLTSAPALPATTLASYCYGVMFQGCTSLKVNENGAGTKIFTCPSTSGLNTPVTNMFNGTGGSFTGDPTTGNTYNWYS